MQSVKTGRYCVGGSPDAKLAVILEDRWATKYPKRTHWVEEPIGETLTFTRLPRAHHKHLKSTHRLERLNEIKRRTRVVRIFPNGESCLRLVRALCVEIP